ncbi:(2Fe-2S)-binding protein [Nocardia terpenica]|nr:(2Fe-2S)-binding protein [Nocardia terpenica]MBF6102636.1 (2Fe-2S)-binding protein [Nocardia terpenica]MBF6111173.1 (2Fe-2S)-binding protein [Nocardia terpenica]MBF6117304.1 (2Fe-2S)-binding protein [Nocardia terpenica]MBF6150855.1 (2Fe-2S)-binding protein [Nocardia terpenica]
MVAESAEAVVAVSETGPGAMVPATVLTSPRWLAERIADMGISWGTGDSRVSGTLWWCMAASSLIDPIVTAYATRRRAPSPELDHLLCEIRPDGGVERVLPLPGDVPQDPAEVGRALRKSLARIIPAVAEVSGASVASLWAVVADAIGNRALDAGDAEAGSRLAGEVAGRLPVPRFTDVGGRTFVRRISCCLVFEAPGCQMCTSCPKRPPAQRHAMLTELAARG